MTTTLPKGIVRQYDGSFRASVRVRPFPPEFQRFPEGTPIQEMQDWRTDTRKDYEDRRPPKAGPSGTLSADVEKYLEQKRDELTDGTYASVRSELAAWVKLFGARRRHSLKKDDAIKARRIWKEANYADKTIDNRFTTFAAFCHTLDGEKAKTPVDDLDRLIDPKTVYGQPRVISAEVIRTVAANLLKNNQPIDLAWLLVLSATGRRPSEIRRTIPETDLDLNNTIWQVRTGKGGDPTPYHLNAEALRAWQYFVAVGAFATHSDFDGSEFVKRLYAAGWPMEWDETSRRRRNRLRPYQARHSVALALAEDGVEWEEIRGVTGHKHLETLKRFYTGFVRTRLRATSNRLAEARPLGIAGLLDAPPPKKPRTPRVVRFDKKRREEVKAG